MSTKYDHLSSPPPQLLVLYCVHIMFLITYKFFPTIVNYFHYYLNFTLGKELPFEMDVIEIFTSIVKGVSHIHSRGLIHRDLKVFFILLFLNLLNLYSHCSMCYQCKGINLFFFLLYFQYTIYKKELILFTEFQAMLSLNFHFFMLFYLMC